MREAIEFNDIVYFKHQMENHILHMEINNYDTNVQNGYKTAYDDFVNFFIGGNDIEVTECNSDESTTANKHMNIHTVGDIL